MFAKRLSQGDTIGIICPSHIFDANKYAPGIAAIERLGFKVKLGANVSKDTYGFVASAEERALDLNTMVADDSVKMLLFGGGNSAAEILPLIDYDNIHCHPKLFSSYSDGTSILNMIHAQTGLVTYYGYGAGEFFDLRHYDYMQFCMNFVEGYSSKQFISDSTWQTLNGGSCEGTLIGGFTLLFGLMLGNKRFKYDSNKNYLLFLEDNFGNVGAVSTYLTFIEQSTFFQNLVGLIFGHFTGDLTENFLHCLERFGKRNNIPVVYTDDFGHGTRHAIFPIGVNATLDADKQTLTFNGE